MTPEPAPETRPALLVVEDEPQMRLFLRAALATHGYWLLALDTSRSERQNGWMQTLPSRLLWVSLVSLGCGGESSTEAAAAPDTRAVDTAPPQDARNVAADAGVSEDAGDQLADAAPPAPDAFVLPDFLPPEATPETLCLGYGAAECGYLYRCRFWTEDALLDCVADQAALCQAAVAGAQEPGPFDPGALYACWRGFAFEQACNVEDSFAARFEFYRCVDAAFADGAGAPGDPCASDADCAQGWCRREHRECPGSCVAYQAEGEPCDFGDLQCGFLVDCGADGVCGEPAPAAEGEACDPTHPCAAPFRCHREACVPPGGAGEPCGDDRDCDESLDLRCAFRGGERQCVPPLEAGDRCDEGPYCRRGLVCTGACVPALPHGAECDPEADACGYRCDPRTRRCGPTLGEVGATCDPGQRGADCATRLCGAEGTCLSLLPVGEPCPGDFACETGHCDPDGLCAAACTVP